MDRHQNHKDLRKQVTETLEYHRYPVSLTSMIVDGFLKESLLLVILRIVSYTTEGLNLVDSDMVICTYSHH